MSAADARAWWRDAVIYQVYPRSFQDSGGDGVGDLAGIRRRLPYIADLGADAVWISPFVRSPMKDFGYDVSDFRAIEPMFGDMAAFDALVADAHALGLKVLMDQVWNHTSDRHPWFVESRASRDNPRADWYVWADPAADGGPPNNWRSAFGGSAWTFDPGRRQYYLHNFLAEQPDLDWHNPEVRAAMIAIGRFWLERGVDGFRLDVVNFYAHDRSLADNPPRPPDVPRPAGAGRGDPYFDHINRGTVCRPETLAMLGELRALADAYPGTVLLGEVSSAEDSLAAAADYVAGDGRLHLAYNSALVTDEPFTAEGLHALIARAQALFPDHRLCWTFGTHDFPRLKGRWAEHARHAEALERRRDALLAALLATLPGACCIYQGDELGLPQAQLAFEQLRDPFGIANWPHVLGRDGCRTPMPWTDAAPHGGFSSAPQTWLPMPAEHLALAVSRQQGDPGSLLETYRGLLRWRRRTPALRGGALRLFPVQGPVLAFARGSGRGRVVCAFNLSPEAATRGLEAMAAGGTHCRALAGDCRIEGDVLVLPGFGAAVLEGSGCEE
ncbi:alpha-amylase family glycosyl hydrolase [Coralloluteibacterium thermophilus]|uniref:Alpha-amylase family glycosyl hydrolase n=1 Tax=Coralloluteibacterium thermophilum TaxID=2707049 RepID=A0ABV9NF30_9GAMM